MGTEKVVDEKRRGRRRRRKRAGRRDGRSHTPHSTPRLGLVAPEKASSRYRGSLTGRRPQTRMKTYSPSALGVMSAMEGQGCGAGTPSSAACPPYSGIETATGDPEPTPSTSSLFSRNNLGGFRLPKGWSGPLPGHTAQVWGGGVVQGPEVLGLRGKPGAA